MKTIFKDKNSYFNKIKNELELLKGYKYESDLLREYLNEIYFGVCCYCESKFDFSATFNIEHFYPKNAVDSKKIFKYKKYIRSLENLHYSCPKCNNYKSHMCPDGTDSYYLMKSKPSGLLKSIKIYSPNYLLESGVFKIPNYKIEDKFKYDGATIKEVNDIEKRGKGTIDTFNLNNENEEKKERLALFENRQRYFIKATELSKLIKNNINSNNNDILIFFIKELGDMMINTSAYSSMIRCHFIDIYDIAFKIILNQKKS